MTISANRPSPLTLRDWARCEQVRIAADLALSRVGRHCRSCRPEYGDLHVRFAAFDVTPPSPGWLFVPVPGSQ
jgi:hypothetical protein